MMAAANVPANMKIVLMPEAVKTATFLDGLIPINIDGAFKTKFVHQFGFDPPLPKLSGLGERLGPAPLSRLPFHRG
jgi:hypothetical protein